MKYFEIAKAHRLFNWAILVVAVAAVPFTHGVLEYCGLILAAILLTALNRTIARKRIRTGGPK